MNITNSQLNITNAQYQSLKADNVVVDAQHVIKATIDGTEMFVPLDPDNTHYAAIKAKHDDPNDSFTIADAD